MRLPEESDREHQSRGLSMRRTKLFVIAGLICVPMASTVVAAAAPPASAAIQCYQSDLQMIQSEMDVWLDTMDFWLAQQIRDTAAADYEAAEEDYREFQTSSEYYHEARARRDALIAQCGGVFVG